jgi:Uma2 family endonuclease
MMREMSNVDERWEIIDGVAYAMTAPNRQHQEISREIMFHFTGYLRGKKCQVYAAPFDVRLPEKEETEKTTSTIVQPDIAVVCATSKMGF